MVPMNRREVVYGPFTNDDERLFALKASLASVRCAD